MCPRTCALGLSSSLLSENKKKTTKVCEIGDRESFFGALFILWIHGKNSHIRTTCKLGGHDLVNFLKVVFFQFVVLFFCALFLNLAESCPAIGVDRRKKVWSWSGRGSFIDGTLVVCFLVRISQRFQ